MIAYALEEQGFAEESIYTFERILKLRPEEPISKRDLALALARNGEHLRALSLLYEVITGKWDERFR